jgi:hypothetical protein
MEVEPGATRPHTAHSQVAAAERGSLHCTVLASIPATAKLRRIAPSPASRDDIRDESGGAKGIGAASLPSQEHAPPVLLKAPSVVAAQSAAALRVHLRRELLYGFLFLSYRDATYATGPLLLLSSCGVACITVFAAPPSDGEAEASRRSLFLFGMLWTIQTGLTAHYLPYHSLMSNGKEVALGLAALAHTILMLGLQSGGTGSAYLVGLLVVFGCLSIAVFLRQAWIKRHKPNWTRQKTQWARVLKQEATEAEGGTEQTALGNTLDAKEVSRNDAAQGQVGVADEGNSAPPLSPSHRYAPDGDGAAAAAAAVPLSPSAASSSSLAAVASASSPRSDLRPSSADPSVLDCAVRPSTSSSISVRLGIPTLNGRAQWTAMPLHSPDEPTSIHAHSPLWAAPRPSLLSSIGEPLSPAGLHLSTASGRSPRRISGAVHLTPLQHKRTVSAASANTVKLHLPPSLMEMGERPFSGDAQGELRHSVDTAASNASCPSAVNGAASMSLDALPPLRKPPRILLVPLPRACVASASAAAVGSPPTPSLPTAESTVLSSSSSLPAIVSASSPVPVRPSLLDVDGVLEEFEQNEMDKAHAHEKERARQMQRARRAKEQRMRARQEAAAAMAMAAAAVDPSMAVPSPSVAAPSSAPASAADDSSVLASSPSASESPAHAANVRRPNESDSSSR